MKDEGSGCVNNKENPYPGDCEFTGFLLEKAAKKGGLTVRNLNRQECLAKAKGIKMLLLDVDGVLTDGSITYTHAGEEIKTFNCRDGFGINILRKAGVEVGLITARRSEALIRRTKDLSLQHVYQGKRNKVEVYNQILADLDLTPAQIAYMGDDWLDLSLMSRVGLAAAVADATPEVKSMAHYVSDKNGGKGAVRDLCDLIIEAQGKHQSLLEEYLNRS